MHGTFVLSRYTSMIKTQQVHPRSSIHIRATCVVFSHRSEEVSQRKSCVSPKEEVETAKPLLRHMSNILQTHAGKHQCGEASATKSLMSYDDLKQAVSKAVTIESGQVRNTQSLSMFDMRCDCNCECCVFMFILYLAVTKPLLSNTLQ